MRKVFISFCWADRLHVDQLIEQLKVLGCQTYGDDSLPAGATWWAPTAQEIADCDVFIAIISREALNAKHCQREYECAESLGKPVLPVALEPPPPVLPRRYSTRHILDLSVLNYSDPGQRDRAALLLAQSLANLPPAPPLPQPLPKPPPAPLSHLADLVELLKAPNTLTHDQQREILGQVKNAIGSLDREEQRSGRFILDLLRRRGDLVVDVDRLICDDPSRHTNKFWRFLESSRPLASAT